MNPLQWLGNLWAPNKRASLTDADLFTLISNGPSTHAGPPVNEESALRYGAVYACIRIISESIAALPLVLMRQKGREKERAINHSLYSVLHSMANPYMTSFEWRELAMSHVLAWGNSWSEIQSNERGQIAALWPLNPAKMEGYEWRGGELWWKYRQSDSETIYFSAGQIHHIKGPGDGIMGASPIRLAARQATGLGLATEEYGARFFSNGARPGAVLKHPGKLSEGAYERLKASFSNEHQGLGNSHRTKILEEGMDITTIGIPPNEAQFLETRKFQVTEIARIYRVPPHMLADLDRATFSNIEHQSLNFVIHTLMPWIVRHEQAVYRDLLLERERPDHYAKYIVAGMLRGDMATRSQAYTTGISAGYYTRNEIRELEDLNPLEGLDKPLVPLNMVEVGQEPQSPSEARTAAHRGPQQEERAASVARKRQALMNRHVGLFGDAAERAAKREIADIRKALAKYLGKSEIDAFVEWLAGFYGQMREWMPGYYRALMLAYFDAMMASVADELDTDPLGLDDDAREWIEKYLANFTEVYAVGGEKQIRALLAGAANAEEAADLVEARLAEWEEKKAGKTALDQAFEAGNALTILGYTLGGVTILRWYASGDSCPLCQKMNGKRIKMGGAFLKEGDEVTADGVDPLPVVRTIGHAPLHQGCNCTVLAG